ncbi:MAG TPA: glycosyltransferase family 4 protein [Gemmatimonadales bacterium]|nr:glycosyltransferase family 4 protein [Gemmatimonadales bacterium]
MRVVFLTHNFPRWPGDLSGSFLATLAAALVGRGIQVTVVAPSDGGQGGEAETGGVRVRRVRYAPARLESLAYRGTMAAALAKPGGWRVLAGLWRALRRAAREELAAGADLIHAHWWVPAGLAAPADAPLVVTVHGTDAAMLRSSRLARRLARPVFARARVVTAVSRELAGWVQNATGRHISAAHIQPMPVDSANWPWTTGGGGTVVVARLTAQKRIHLAIDTTAFLASCGHDLPLTIVGDGPERPMLERQVERLGIGPFVRFAGAVPPSEVASFLARADLLLAPAAGEGFGLAAAEALMAGVPVVACWDGGGLLDVVPESGAGRLTLPSAEALSDATLDLLQDPERLALARLVGESWRSRLSPDYVAEVCEGWYREALDG